MPLPGVGEDGMASSMSVVPPTPIASECTDLEFTLENVDKVRPPTYTKLCYAAVFT